MNHLFIAALIKTAQEHRRINCKSRWLVVAIFCKNSREAYGTWFNRVNCDIIYLINNGHIETKAIYDATKRCWLKKVDGIMHDCLHQAHVKSLARIISRNLCWWCRNDRKKDAQCRKCRINIKIVFDLKKSHCIANYERVLATE